MSLLDIIIICATVSSVVALSVYAGILIGKNKSTDQDEERR